MTREGTYPSDSSDTEWAILKPLAPPAGFGTPAGSRPVEYERRDIVDGIAYVVRTGGAWRQLTVDLPPWETVGASTRGHDAGKRTNGRTRHIIVDTAGCC